MPGFDASYLEERLAAVRESSGASPSRYVVAFSGGVDSSVLLSALVESGADRPILALHVDHGLHERSAAWGAAAAAFAEALGVEFRVERVDVERDSAKGLEAAARAARYAVFERILLPGDWLLSAHHRDDQAETLLLNLLRGSGPLGLAGMPEARALGQGLLVRPLLGISRRELEAFALDRGIRWAEDPANRDPRFDRSYLRKDILGRLEQRWPAVRERMARSAELAAQAQTLLDELAAEDRELATTGSDDRLSIPVLQGLSPARRRNVLRYAVRSLGLPLPPSTRLEQLVRELMPAREDAAPVVVWDGVEVRRYRDELFILSGPPPVPPAGLELGPDRPADLGPGLGSLELRRDGGIGIRAETAERGFDVRFRLGGERLRPVAGGGTRRLKALLQGEGVLPWLRSCIPLLEQDGALVAVADFWIDAGFQEAGGYRVVWHDAPILS